MFSHEKTPLRGSDHYVPYVFMSDRQAALRRKVKQYQCLICTTVVLTLSMMFVIMLMSYSDMSVDDNVDDSGFLQRPLKKAALTAGSFSDDFDLSGKNGIPRRQSLSYNDEINGKPKWERNLICNQTKYRSPDGVCNNLVNPLWGSSNQPLKRFIPADYCDGLSSPRCSVNKFDLPSSYFVTAKIRNSIDGVQKVKNDIEEITKLLWGEFIYQDMVNINEYGPPELLNKATSFLDGSNIYGNTEIDQRKVRTFFNGELSTDKYNDNKYSAISVSKDSKCINGSIDYYIFEKILVKQHNSVASKLKSLNPHWNDEKLFLESRRIITAQIQHVSFNEFLEYVVGKQVSNIDLKSGYSKKYNEAVDPSISDVFATAAFKSFFEKFSKTRLGFVDGRCDFYSIAHNIQRGRDHGLPGYTKWREFCGLPKPVNFEDLYQILGENNTELIRSLYIDVADIDLLVGIILETPVKDSIFGQVGLCLITDQFRRIMLGDRYWFEVNEMPQKFSEEQLTEIRKTTLSSLICGYLENDGQFIYKNFSPECSISSKINLIPWLEEKPLTSMFIPATNDNSENVVLGNNRLDPGLSFNQNLLGSGDKSNVVKRSISFNVNVLNITARYSNGTMIYEGEIQKPPILFPLDRVIGPYGYTPSADVDLIGTIEGNQIVGSFSVPLKNIDGTSGKTEGLKVNFEGDISFKWGNTIELKGNDEYKCKVLFQSYAKLTNQDTSEQTVSLKSATQNEQCTIMLVGTFYQRPFYCSIFPWWCLDGKLFYWSGDSKIVFKSIIENNDNNKIVPNSKKEVLKSISLKQKTNDVIVDKLFASVTVVTGKISGSFDDNEVIDVFTGSPPIDINLDHIISPNAYDTSFQLVWTGTPIDDSSIKGTLSVPYYTDVGTASKRMFKANYTFDVIYKYGGSIGIIDPTRTYTCKVMFPSVKKATLQSTLSPIQTIKGKTPFGESCSIMLGGYFKQQMLLCKITPWWCSNEKIFYWNGEAELTFKYKYNASDNAINKPLYQSIKNYAKDNKNFVLSDPFKNQGYELEGKSIHRLGGKVRKGWIQIKNSGFFQSSKTIWSGELPTTIEMPLFWKPQNFEDQLDLSDVFGHEVIWSCSIFQTTIQGSFLFPQYVGHNTPPLVNWIKGSFSMDLELEETVSLYNIVVPGLSYRSRINFHDVHSPDFVPFSTPQKEGPVQDDVYLGTKAPLILLGKYSPNHNSFIWNGSFIIIFTKTPEDYRLF